MTFWLCFSGFLAVCISLAWLVAGLDARAEDRTRQEREAALRADLWRLFEATYPTRSKPAEESSDDR
jgi:hypothetical protein